MSTDAALTVIGAVAIFLAWWWAMIDVGRRG